MNTTLSRFNEARQPLEAVLDAVSNDHWSAPSPCEDWSAHDVLTHVIETQRGFFGERGFDVGAGPDPDADPAAAWRDHAQWVADVLKDDFLVAAEYTGYFGPTTMGETFTQFYVWDMLVHRWDIATAAGLDAHLTDAEVESIDQGAGAFGDNLYMEGICKPPLDGDPDSNQITRVLAKLGRQT